LLGEREERQHERHDDGTEDESEAVRLATGTDRAANASAIEGRNSGASLVAWRAGRPRQPECSRTCALVDSHWSVA